MISWHQSACCQSPQCCSRGARRKQPQWKVRTLWADWAAQAPIHHAYPAIAAAKCPSYADIHHSSRRPASCSVVIDYTGLHSDMKEQTHILGMSGYGFVFTAYRALASTLIQGLTEYVIYPNRIPHNLALNMGTHWRVKKKKQKRYSSEYIII